jgi:hypothetical protein
MKYQLGDRKPTGDNKKMKTKYADPETDSCKHGNETSVCVNLGDILEPE